MAINTKRAKLSSLFADSYYSLASRVLLVHKENANKSVRKSTYNYYVDTRACLKQTENYIHFALKKKNVSLKTEAKLNVFAPENQFLIMKIHHN